MIFDHTFHCTGDQYPSTPLSRVGVFEVAVCRKQRVFIHIGAEKGCLSHQQVLHREFVNPGKMVQVSGTRVKLLAMARAVISRYAIAMGVPSFSCLTRSVLRLMTVIPPGQPSRPGQSVSTERSCWTQTGSVGMLARSPRKVHLAGLVGTPVTVTWRSRLTSLAEHRTMSCGSLREQQDPEVLPAMDSRRYRELLLLNHCMYLAIQSTVSG